LRFRADSISLAEFDLLRDCRDSDRQMTGWDRPEHDGIGTDATFISDIDVPEYFRSSADYNSITDSRRSAPTSEISQSYVVVKRAAFADHGLWMHDDAAEMMNS
jgi:hypothetical protein